MQFIAGRLDLMNAGIEVADVFEQEISNEGGGMKFFSNGQTFQSRGLDQWTTKSQIASLYTTQTACCKQHRYSIVNGNVKVISNSRHLN